MGAAGNKKPKKSKDKKHVPAYEMSEVINDANKKKGNQKLVVNDWITEGDTASLQRPVFISSSRRFTPPLNPVKVKKA